MAVLLVGVANCIGQIAILLDLPFNGMGRDALAGVAVSAVDNTPPTGVSA